MVDRRVGRDLEKRIQESPVFSNGLTGFTLLDPETGRIVADVNGDKCFIPASNTKILTLTACLHVLGDSLPAIQTQRYVLDAEEDRAVLLVRGTGDPTLLHPKFQAWPSAFHFLKNSAEAIQVYPRQGHIERFGPGWAWDDYEAAYQPERSAIPLYGNVVQVAQTSTGYTVEPPFFTDHFIPVLGWTGKPKRPEFENRWVLSPHNPTARTLVLPFTQVDLGLLLTDTLDKPVEALTGWEYEYVPNNWQTHYGTPIDTVLRRMMHQSDNFIAEQLLLVCAGQRFDVLRSDTLIRWMLDSVLTDLPQRPRWVDGSGLSRYNLISPRDLAEVLRRLWAEQPHERLLDWFPAGGRDGTLAEWYAGAGGRPYVFAKTGGMSGVHCLSGYVQTHSGKTLIFSFMHNNFVGPSTPWKIEMQPLLEYISRATRTRASGRKGSGSRGNR